jgi:hypothetical protein
MRAWCRAFNPEREVVVGMLRVNPSPGLVEGRGGNADVYRLGSPRLMLKQAYEQAPK